MTLVHSDSRNRSELTMNNWVLVTIVVFNAAVTFSL
jgi:hypothetical protein